MVDRDITPEPVGNPHPEDVFDTPAVSRSGHSLEYQTARLEDRRYAVAQSMVGQVKEIPVSLYLGAVLPPVSKSRVKRVLSSLGTGAEPVLIGGKWIGFKNQPRCSTFSEEAIFANLVAIINAIAAAGRGRGLVHYESNPNCQPDYTSRNCSSRPDGWFILNGCAPFWIFLVCFAEFKKSDSEAAEQDNILKILWSFQQSMSDDPRRRFSFGFTIENTTMKLWYTDRSRSLCTEKFDFTTELALVVHFFLGVIDAKEHELGWDTTMTLLPPDVDSGIQYDIVVRSEKGNPLVFRTLELISDANTDSLLARGTRVWKAIRVVRGVPTGDPVVLKDCWIDEDRSREGEILRQLETVGDVNLFKDLFLDVVYYGDVFIKVGNKLVLDNTRSLLLRDCSIPEDLPVVDIFPKSTSDKKTISIPTTGSIHLYARDISGNLEPFIDRVKTHHRSVFRQVCKPLYEVTSLGTALNALAVACRALLYMHEAGWVHRDVNIGNILLDTTGKVKVRLADLEYAKRIDDFHEGHPIRTAFAEFTPVEVDAGRYLFCTSVSAKDDPSPSQVEDSERLGKMAAERALDSIAQYEASKSTSGPECSTVSIPTSTDSDTNSKTSESSQMTVRQPSFRYNKIHDVESVWWGATYIITRTDLVSFDESNEVAIQKFAKSLFFDRASRHYVFIGGIDEDVLLLFPQPVQAFARALEKTRMALVQLYHQAEQDLDLFPSAAATTVLYMLLQNLSTHGCHIQQDEIRRSNSRRLTVTGKRSRSADEEPEGPRTRTRRDRS